MHTGLPAAARRMPMIKRLFPGVIVVLLACAPAGAQQSAPLSSRLQATPPPASTGAARADFRDVSAPEAVQRMADWVVVSADNAGLPFIVVDKKDAEVFVFDARGRILGAAAALLGLAVGDDSAPGVGNKPLSAIPPSERTTPAGRFVAYMGHERGQPDFLWVDYKDNISLHRVVTGRPQDHRLQRLATPTPLDNRITFGCINVPADFFERTVLPAFASTEGIVYVLPEIKPTRDVFSHYFEVGA